MVKICNARASEHVIHEINRVATVGIVFWRPFDNP